MSVSMHLNNALAWGPMALRCFIQMGVEMERVQQERDAALVQLAAKTTSSEAADDQLTASRKQLRQVEVRSFVSLLR